MIRPDNPNNERPAPEPGKPSADVLGVQSVQLQMALEAAGMVSWEWDIPSGCIRYSPNVQVLAHGETVAPYCTVDGLLQEVHAEDRETLAQAIRRTVQERRPFECEYRVRMLDGAYHWISSRGKIVAKDGDKPVRVIGISQDITERKRAEERLRASETRYRAVVEDQTECIGRFRLDGTILFVNEACCRLFGKPAHELLTNRWFSLVLPEDLPLVQEKLTDLRPSDPVMTTECRFFAGGGRVPWMQITCRGLFDPQGRLAEVQAAGRDITQRREAEHEIRQLNETLEQRVQERTAQLEAANAALRESQEHLQLALEGANVGTWSWDVEKNLIHWDERIYGLFGFSPHEPASVETWLSHLHPDDREPMRNQIRALLEPGAGDSWNEEYRVLHPTLGLRWIYGLGRIDRDAEGRATRFTGINFDITEHMQAEELLRESEAKYRSLYQSMADAVASVDLQGRFLECNRAYEELVGYSREELHRLTYLDLTPEKWRTLDARMAEQVMTRGFSDTFEKEYRHKDGTVFPVEVRAFLTRDAAGRPVATWGIVRDISGRKRAEEEIRKLNESLEAQVRKRTAQWEKANESLRQSQALLRVVTDNSPEPIFVKDRHGRVTFANPAAAATLGKSPEEMVGKTVLEYLSDPVFSRTILEADRRIMESGTVDVTEHTIPTPAGLRVFLTTKASYRDAAGRVIGLVGIARDITERKQVEEQLRKFSRVVEQSPVSVVITDPRGNIEYVNPKFTVITGYSLDEVRGRNPRILKSGELSPEVYADLWRTITGGGEWRGEFHNKKKNGELFWEKASISPIMDEAGHVMHFVALKEDITERKLAEERLRASEARFRAVVEDQTDAIFRFRHDGTILFANEVFCRLFGKSTHELLGNRWHQLVLPEEVLQIEAKLGTLCPSHPVVEVEKRIASDDGQVHWMQFANRGFFDAQGRLVEVQAVGRDITERKQAEERLQASEARYRAVVENQTEVICRLRADGTILFINEMFCRLLGKSAEEVIGTRWQPIPMPEDVSYIEEQLGTLCPAHPIVEIENRVIDSQGRVLWMQFINRGIFDAQGRLVEVQAVGRDITDRREAEEEIRRLNETLEERVRERTVLLEAANLALQLSEAKLEKQVETRTEELRSANAALEQRSRQLAQLAADLTTAEHRERRRLADLLHDHPQQLLVAARMQVDDLRKREELHNLTQLDILQRAVNEALTSVRTLTTNMAPPVFLQKDMATALQWLAQDMHRHHQLTVTVSVGNALDSLTEAMSVLLFTAARELLLNVVKHAGTQVASLRLRRSASGIELQVKDKGRGMDQDAQRALLAHPGFGLFSIRERVGLLGGRLRLNSVPGRGTCVTVLFPVGSPAPAPAPRGGDTTRTTRRRKPA